MLRSHLFTVVAVRGTVNTEIPAYLQSRGLVLGGGRVLGDGPLPLLGL